MLKRVLSAVVALPVVLLLLWLGGYATFLLISIVVVAANLEYGKLSRAKGIPHSTPAAIGLGLLYIIDAQFFSGFHALAITVLTLFLSLMIPVLKGKPEGSLSGTAALTFASLYLGWSLSHAIMIRAAFEGLEGFVFIIAMLGLVWIHDTAALIFGLALGGRIKIAPHISPKKSLEGSLGGFIVTVLLVFLVYPALAGLGYVPAIGTLAKMLLVAITVLSCTYGDLGESALKRDGGVKDSGVFLPGHGGFMDRIDSLLLFIPSVYWLFYLILGW